MKSNKKAFTLIELIVVMVIIGILVLLATPRFLNYLEKARYTQIINDSKVVESVSLGILVKDDELPIGTDTKEAIDLNLRSLERRVYSKDGLVLNESDDFLPKIARISKTKGDTLKGYYLLNKDIFIKPETKSRLKGQFYIDREGFVLYVDTKSALGDDNNIDLGELDIEDLGEGNKDLGDDLFQFGKYKYRRIRDKGHWSKDEYSLIGFEDDYKSHNGGIEKEANDIGKVFIGGFYDYKTGETNKYKNIAVLDVKKIGQDSFRFENLINELVIPDSVEEIGYTAFANFYSGDYRLNKITSLKLGKSIKEIKGNAFMSNSISGNFVIPDSLIEIGPRAFHDNEIESISFGKSIEKLGDNTFSKNKIGGHMIMSDSIRDMGSNVFFDNEIEKVTISKNIKKIPSSMLSGNQINGEVIIPDSVEEIGMSAFSGNEIESLLFGENINKIGPYAFSNNEIKSLNLPDSLVVIGSHSFYKNKIKGHIIIPNLVETIESRAFMYNDIDSIELGRSLKEIELMAFKHNLLKGEIRLPKSLETVGDNSLPVGWDALIYMPKDRVYDRNAFGDNRNIMQIYDEFEKQESIIGYNQDRKTWEIIDI